MHDIKGYIFGVATVVSMISGMVTIFVVPMGLLVGIFLSLLACFVRSLRCAALYVLLVPLCAAAGISGVFCLFFNVVGSHLEMDQLFRAAVVSGGASLTFGALLGAGLGFLLARFFSRRLRHSTILLTPPQPADGSRVG
jgi:hypothetical protein